jgi:peptide/nickel transport system substrate-binding protein
VANGQWRLLPDGRMETTWKLRSGVVWHDGAPFTAEDLVFTTMVAQDKSLAMLLDPAYEYIESVAAPDPMTFVARWKQPFIGADRLLSHAEGSSVLPMPRHLLEGPYSGDDKAAFTAHPYWGPEFVGLGPFWVREFVADSHLVLTANERYVLGRPKIDEIDVRFVGDFTVMVAQVLSGAVDFTLGRGLSLEQAIQARDNWRDGRMDTALNNISALWPQFVNPSPAVVGDLSFRRAMLHAIDRQQLGDSLQAGLSPVAHSPLTPTDPDAKVVESRAVRYEHDPRQAVRLLEGIGLVRGPDGYFRDPSSGERLTLKIQTTNDDLREKMMPVIGEDWRQIGVAMEPVIIPRQLSSDRRLRTEFASFDFTRQPTDLTRYHSSQAPLPDNNYRGSNRSRYRNADLDALIERYFVTIVPEQRTPILGDMVAHMTDNVVVLGIFFIVEPALISNRIANVTPRQVEDVLHTWNAHEWEIRS